MCAERVGFFSHFKQEQVMFHPNPKYNANIYIGIKFMKDGW